MWELINEISSLIANICTIFICIFSAKIFKNININFKSTLSKFNSLTDVQKRYLAYFILSNKINKNILLNDDIIINTNIKNTNKLHGLLFYISIINFNDIKINNCDKYYNVMFSNKLIKLINDYININNLNLNNIDIYDK